VFPKEIHFSVECKGIGKLISKHIDPRHSYTTGSTSLTITHSLFTHVLYNLMCFNTVSDDLLYCIPAEQKM